MNPKKSARYQDALNRGLTYNSKKQWKEAIALFRVSLQESPNDAVVYAGIGEACFGLKMYDKALECYKLAARYSQGNINYLNKVADVQERLGQLNDASRTYMAAGETFLRFNRLEEAVANWERAVRLEPNLLGAHQRLAMVFQRQNNIKAAVREYLAIARILQFMGEKQKALQMCQAALRLDPDNSDILTAMELVRYGEEGFADEPEAPTPVIEEEKYHVETSVSLTDTVRQLAGIFEAEKQSRQAPPQPAKDADPIAKAQQIAQNQLAEEMFRDEDDGDERTSLSKLERDALIGQAMDSEQRGRIDEAIGCYERAIRGGVTLPAAFFVLGLLYNQQKRTDFAKRALLIAGKDPIFQPACRILLAPK